ncbi:MAG: hypothetical protein IT484_00610 [Gammaproteobacteria bacterium]|nr:hypothetical protein [Gammaproteobacteria bacterium]
MTRLASVLLGALAAAMLQPAGAACEYPGEISIPGGASATEAQMQAANQAVRQYMAAVESYLACLDEEEKALGASVTDEQKKVHIQRHNAAVDALNAVAARYNEQVQAFKKKKAQ